MAEAEKTTERVEQPRVLGVGPGPHLAAGRTTRAVMIDVLIGLAPAMAAAGWVFHWHALKVIAACVLGCLAAEVIFTTGMRRKPLSIGDFSAAVTGVILALSLPATCPAWVAVIGAFVAIGIGKVVFGGLGHNIFNPAMVGRAFVMMAFTGLMAAGGYRVQLSEEEARPGPEVAAMLKAAEGPQAKRAAEEALAAELHARRLAKAGGVEALTQATPMTGIFDEARKLPKGSPARAAAVPEGTLLRLVLGNVNGSLGETSAVALLLGGLYLILRRTASWQIPAGAFVGLLAVAGLDNLLDPANPWTAAHHLAGGAFLLGALFIVTDPVSSPLTPRGKWIFGAVFGVLVMGIRLFTNYPEGVMFSVLLVNAVVPLLNRWTIPRPVGGPTPAPAPAK